MAQNIFDATLDPNNDIKVNNFDWSHANNLTTQIGRITPIFCDMVPAKTSFRVNPRFGLQFMPMVFPIQTRMKARIIAILFVLFGKIIRTLLVTSVKVWKNLTWI
jgi:hypothetical protein